jgi:probable F420-dependent oxidoreductase
MKLGAIFPINVIGTDPAAIRDYIVGVEEIGYDHMVIYDHVLGADASARANWGSRYSITDAFHEPFVVLGYASALTRRIGLVTGVLVLPQRQTVLAAKQAAEIDVLSGGRLTLGVGVGWNEVEYEALGEDFHNRGRRLDEQIRLMRELWTRPVVTFEGRWHKVTAAGLNPLPVQRPIPVWMGGRSDAMLQRIAREGDGWFPLFPLDDAGRATVDQFIALLGEAARKPGTVGIEAHVSLRDGGEDYWRRTAESWKAAGATAMMVNTMSFSRQRMAETRSSFTTVTDHLNALRKAMPVLSV